MEISSDFLTALCVEAIHGLDGLQQIPVLHTYHTNSHEIDRILTTPMLKYGWPRKKVGPGMTVNPSHK